jgi:MOSC domain-containing protein YiiM
VPEAGSSKGNNLFRVTNETWSLDRLFAAPIRPGVVTWIGLRPARRQPLIPVAEADLDPLTGLAGDHYRSGRDNTRQVTLVGREDLDSIASYLGLDSIGPASLRRNLVTTGINLRALKGNRVRIGSAVLEITGECHPCSRMEETFGPGGYNAVRGHGGMTARVIAAGRCAIGDPVVRF